MGRGGWPESPPIDYQAGFAGVFGASSGAARASGDDGDRERPSSSPSVTSDHDGAGSCDVDHDDAASCEADQLAAWLANCPLPLSDLQRDAIALIARARNAAEGE